MSTHKKHILIVLQRYHAGGAERQAQYLAEGLRSNGFLVSFLAFGAAEGLTLVRLKSAKFDVYNTSFTEKILLETGKGLWSTINRLRYSWLLIERIRQIGPDIILPFTYRPNVIIGRLWRFTGASKCYWNQRDEGRSFLGRKSEIRALDNCSGIISNSLEGKLFLSKYTNKEISLVHNAVFIPDQSSHPRAGTILRVAMVANLTRFKDHMTLLKAWKILAAQHLQCQLFLVGRDGDRSDVLKSFVQENGLSESVTFTGQVQDVTAFLRETDIAVFSSVNEGVPNGVLESMAMGLPVVATRILGTEEALGNDYPYLATPDSPEDLAIKLWQLIENPDAATEWGKKNKERVRQHFSYESMVKNYMDALKLPG